MNGISKSRAFIDGRLPPPISPQADAIEPLPDDQHLCTHCALCCSGPVFNHIAVRPEDVPDIERTGFNVETFHDGPGFALPCSFLAGTRCSIYPGRPRSCRSFRCKLLRAVDAGETGITEALAVVDEAKRLLAAAAVFYRDGESVVDARLRWKSCQSAWWLGAGPDAARFHLAMVMLNLFIDRNFRDEGMMAERVRG